MPSNYGVWPWERYDPGEITSNSHLSQQIEWKTLVRGEGRAEETKEKTREHEQSKEGQLCDQILLLKYAKEMQGEGGEGKGKRRVENTELGDAQSSWALKLGLHGNTFSKTRITNKLYMKCEPIVLNFTCVVNKHIAFPAFEFWGKRVDANERFFQPDGVMEESQKSFCRIFWKIVDDNFRWRDRRLALDWWSL